MECLPISQASVALMVGWCTVRASVQYELVYNTDYDLSSNERYDRREEKPRTTASLSPSFEIIIGLRFNFVCDLFASISPCV